MVGCVLSQLKPSELCIISCVKNLVPSASSFIHDHIFSWNIGKPFNIFRFIATAVRLPYESRTYISVTVLQYRYASCASKSTKNIKIAIN